MYIKVFLTLIIITYFNEGNDMTRKQEFYKITLVSATIILMLRSTAGAASFADITTSDEGTVSVIDTRLGRRKL